MAPGFLRLGSLPSWITAAPDVDKVLRIMNGTRFGHPDRLNDRVSKEIRGTNLVCDGITSGSEVGPRHWLGGGTSVVAR